MDKLSEKGRLIVARAQKIECLLPQPFFVAEVFIGSPRIYVGLAKIIKRFKLILSRELDGLPWNTLLSSQADKRDVTNV